MLLDTNDLHFRLLDVGLDGLPGVSVGCANLELERVGTWVVEAVARPVDPTSCVSASGGPRFVGLANSDASERVPKPASA